MSYYLYIICCHKNVLGSKLLKLLTEALVLSHLNYSLPVWGTSLCTQLLQDLRGCRIGQCIFVGVCTSTINQHLHWLLLDSFLQHCSLCLMYHQFNGMWCIPLQPPILFGRHHHHNTRVCSFFANLSRYHLTFSQRHFHYRTSQWWNGLPNYTVAISDSHSFLFSCNLFNHLCNLPYKVVAFDFVFVSIRIFVLYPCCTCQLCSYVHFLVLYAALARKNGSFRLSEGNL